MEKFSENILKLLTIYGLKVIAAVAVFGNYTAYKLAVQIHGRLKNEVSAQEMRQDDEVGQLADVGQLAEASEETVKEATK